MGATKILSTLSLTAKQLIMPAVTCVINYLKKSEINRADTLFSFCKGRRYQQSVLTFIGLTHLKAKLRL